jgi:hypothetical protein
LNLLSHLKLQLNKTRIFLIKSLKEPEDKIGGNKFSHLSLEDFKEMGDETFVWESFEKKLSAYSFLKYLVQENDIHVDLFFLHFPILLTDDCNISFQVYFFSINY